MPPKDLLKIEKVLELKESLIDYFATNAFSDRMHENTALEREVCDALYDVAGDSLQNAANIAIDDLRINADDLDDIYSLAEAAAAAQDALTIAILKKSPLFDIV